MATMQQSELIEFHEFLGKHLTDPQPHRSPEELLEEWRVRRGDLSEYESDVAAIRAALDDMERGDHGTDAREFIRELEASLLPRTPQ